MYLGSSASTSGYNMIQSITTEGTAFGNLILQPDGGNLGIGNTSPTSRLVIQGSGTTSATSTLNVINSSGASLLFVRNDSNVRIGIEGAGSHISVSNPSLSILGTTTDNPILRLGTVGGTTTYFDFFRNNANGSLNIQGAQTSFNNIILGPTSGNVGIGINAPGSRLVIKGAGTTTGTTLNVTNSSNDSRLLVVDNGNIGISVISAFGNGVKVIGISNATTVPNANPSGGGVLYVEAGALKYRGSSGTITTIAPA
jgi:hypothetical protein